MGMLEIDWRDTLQTLLQLGVAFCLAIPVAWDRERHTKIMGLRTFPLVAMGSCAFVLVGESFIGPDDSDAQARLLQGMMAGIGFIGGGAILKGKDHVAGTASAASIWMMGAIGAAVAHHLYGMAIALSLANVLVLRLFTPLKSTG